MGAESPMPTVLAAVDAGVAAGAAGVLADALATVSCAGLLPLAVHRSPRVPLREALRPAGERVRTRTARSCPSG